MAERRDLQAPDIPELDLPVPRAAPAASARPAPSSSGRPALRGASLPVDAPHPEVRISESLDDFGMEIDRGNVSSPPAGHSLSGKPIAIDVSGGDDFDMEIERGGALVSTPPATSGRPPLTTSGRPASAGQASAGQASGLEITYRRPDAARATEPTEPTAGERVIAYAVTTVACLGTAAAFAKLFHRAEGWSVTSALPHAFDATSTTESGAVAIGALVVGIGLGFAGLKLRPRSYALIGSAAMLLVASLAMVTVTLVATEEHPTPPDGALLIPYVLPFAILLLGIGIAGRGITLFQEGGGRRAATLLAAAVGGALVFFALETGAFGRLF